MWEIKVRDWWWKNEQHENGIISIKGICIFIPLYVKFIIIGMLTTSEECLNCFY